MSIANTSPIFPSAVIAGRVTVSTANTNHDGTGTVGTLVTAGAQGTKVDRIVVTAKVTTTAGMIRIFHHDGSAYFLLKEVPVSAVTVSASVAGFTAEVVRTDGLPVASLPSGHSLRVSTHNAEAHDVVAYGGDY